MPTGIGFDKSKADIIDALYAAGGLVTKAAKRLGIKRHALYDHLNLDPELWAELNKARFHGWEESLDDAEDTVRTLTVEKEEDRANAFKAATYLLSQKGRDRGYNQSTESTGSLANEFKGFIDSIKALKDVSLESES